MIKKILPGPFLFVAALLIAGQSFSQERALTQGLKISRSMKIKKAVYQLASPARDSSAVIVIEGDNITVDFNNAVLQGSARVDQPDRFYGIGILIKSGKNITVKNLKAKGYKVAILATNVEKLTLQNCDLSYNYRQRLNSGQEKEDISDWMSYHQNGKDEWLRYGAAIYLKDCNFAVIKDNKVTGGQNALMMTGSNEGMIYNNDFSFNSGIGIGMYRSSRNQVMYNRVIFNVRGYSHGVYNRGQDSAGMLVYEQSSNNLFYKNNVTHSGDGFFLWAGQSTMDSGKGGCNDNVIIGNDFSYAPTNGIEVTFSRNTIIDNRMFECDHGIWGGYSYNTLIRDNNFRNNRIAIAIEHGQENKINHNLFSKDKEAIRLWARQEQPADWGYAKHRDTRSRNYEVVSNSFNSNTVVFNISRTDSLNIFGNTIAGAETFFKIDSTVTNLDTTIYDDMMDKASDDPEFSIPVIDRPNDPFNGSGQFAGRKNILITEWGPYDFRSPIIWHTNPADTSDLMKFDLLGPKGKWRIKAVRGVKDISGMQGIFPASITAKKIPGDNTDILIQLEYTGESITTPFGQIITKGRPYDFTFRKFFQPINFQVRWFAMDTTAHNPLKTGELFPANAKMQPAKTEDTDRLDYAWWGGVRGEETYKQFITVAEGEATIEEGEYELGLTWDDAVRLYIDGMLVINEWNPSLYTFDESPHKKMRLKLGGRHRFLVEHLELGGFATLSLRLQKISR